MKHLLVNLMAVARMEDEAPGQIQDSGPIELTGLAEKWEMNPRIRQMARSKGQLVQWVSPESVGVVSQNLECNYTYTSWHVPDIDFGIKHEKTVCAHLRPYNFLALPYPQPSYTKESHFPEHSSSHACCSHLD